MSPIRSFTGHAAETAPAAPDPGLRGRTYAIPFDAVWNAAVELASGGLGGMALIRADDRAGTLVAEATTRILSRVDDVRIRVRLDDNAQTRVDMRSSSRRPKADLGRNRRRIAAFFRALDGALAATPRQILDATGPS